MGRGKVQLKRIEDNSSRRMSFSKRRTGLLKKARELSVLCDAEVALVVFSSKGNLSEYCSNPSMGKTIIRRRKYRVAERSVNQEDCPHLETDDHELTPCISNTTLQELGISQLNINQIEQREQQFETMLSQMRSRKMELMRNTIRSLQEQVKALEEKDRLTKVESMEPRKTKQSDNKSYPPILDLNESFTDPESHSNES